MTFSPQSPPLRSGDYTRFTTAGSTRIPVATGNTLLIPFTDNWGPLKTFQEFNSWDDYVASAKPQQGAALTEGYVAVYNGFRGTSNAAPGAGKIIGYRMGSSSAAKATKANFGAINGWTVSAKYEGTLGNSIKYDIVANAANPSTQVDVLVYLGNTKVEEYRGYAGSALATLQTRINSDSKWITSAGVSGTTLPTLTTSQSLSGGNDGSNLVAQDWVDFMALAEARDFGGIAPANLTDNAIAASLAVWAANFNAAARGKRFDVWFGGALNESFATAQTQAASYNNENIKRVGVGSYRDSALGLTLSTAQLAPRIAGIQARYGGSRKLDFSYLDDITLVQGPSNFEIETSLTSGVILLTLGVKGVRVESGVTTYISDTPEKPFATYTQVKYVSTMQAIERESRNENEDGTFLGAVVNNEATREALVTREQGRLNGFIRRGEVQPGAQVILSSEANDNDNFVAVDWIGSFARGLDQIRRTIIFS